MLDRWRRLGPQEQHLFLEALAALVSARLTLLVRPFSVTWRALMERKAPSPAEASAAVEPALVTRAVRRASRVIPGSRCLPQALATHTMLARRGIASDVRFGVARDGQRGFEAHAWVELDGAVVIGKLRDLHRYEPLPRPSRNGT